MRSTGATDRMHPAGMAFLCCLALAGNLGRPSLWGHLSFPSGEWAPTEEDRGQVKGCPGHRAGAASALPAFLSPLCFPFPPTTPLCRTPPTPKAPPQAVLTKGWGPEAAGLARARNTELPPPLGRGRLCPPECDCIDISLRMPSDSPEPAVLEGRDLELTGIASR